jgi:uncharacterized protein YqfB (UPF0267 family)
VKARRAKPGDVFAARDPRPERCREVRVLRVTRADNRARIMNLDTMRVTSIALDKLEDASSTHGFDFVRHERAAVRVDK